MIGHKNHSRQHTPIRSLPKSHSPTDCVLHPVILYPVRTPPPVKSNAASRPRSITPTLVQSDLSTLPRLGQTTIDKDDPALAHRDGVAASDERRESGSESAKREHAGGRGPGSVKRELKSVPADVAFIIPLPSKCLVASTSISIHHHYTCSSFHLSLCIRILVVSSIV